jgi:hypothetical protein
MTARHVIGEALFDLTFGAQVPFGEIELAAFVQERLLPVLEEVFDQLSTDGTRCRIDQLVVDLGDIPAGLFMEEMPTRFREELLRRLLEKRTTIRSRPAPGEFVRTPVESRRSRLEQFLETGRLPRDQSDNGPTDIDRLFLETLRAEPAAFAAYVRRSPRREVIIGRLARQFSTDTLASLLRLLSPDGDSEWLSGEAGNSMPAREWRLRNLFSDEPHSSGTAPIGSGTASTGSGTAPAGSGTAPTSGGHQPAGEGETSPTAIREEREGYAVSRLRGRIDHALVFGDPRGIYHSWTHICVAHPALLRAIFMRRMGAAASRRRLSEGFPQSMLLDIVALLAPGHDRLLAALLEQPEMRDSREEERPEEIRNAFWFYTLTYLHNAGPDRFRPEEYLRGLIPHLQQSGMERARVAALVQRVIPAVPRFHEVEAASPARPDAVYRRLLRRLGGDLSEPPMAKEIAWLARAHPELLRQLYHQLQAGDVTLDTGPLDRAEAEALVGFFVNPGHAGAASGFVTEIAKHAEQARDRRRYYLHVLEAIAHNRIVDLEQAMAQGAEAGEGAPGVTEFQARVESLLARAAPDQLERVLDGLEPGQDELVRAAFLRAAANADARRRMALVTPEPLLLRLVTLMVPHEERFFRVLTTSPAMEDHELRLHVWEETLSVLHAEGARRFDHSAFARRLHNAAASQGVRALLDVATVSLAEGTGEADETRLEYLYRRVGERLAGRNARELTNELTELATDYPAVFRHLLTQFHAGAIAIHAPALTPAELGQLSVLASTHDDGRRPRPYGAVDDTSPLASSAARHAKGKQPGEAAFEERRQAPLQELRTRFAEAMVLGRATPVGDCWAECLGHPSMVRSAFMRQMGTETSRQRLADDFPTAMLLDLTALLAPRHHRFIATLLEHTGLHTESHGATSVRELRTAFWSYTLAFLHNTGPGEFLPEAYLRGLTPHLAQCGLEPGRIDALLRHGTPDTPTPGSPPPSPDALYHRLSHRLKGNAGEPVMGDEIRWLARNRPELLQRLFHQWQSGDRPPDLNHIDGDEAEALVTSFVAQEAKASGFVTEIGKHAARARDRRSYFLHLLYCLTSDATVDLELAMGLPPMEDRVAAEPGMPNDAVAHEPVPPSHTAPPHLIAAVERRLHYPHQADSVAPLLEELAQRAPALLADVYKRWRSGEFAAALPTLAPEEIRLFVFSFAELTTGGAMPGFRRQIEARAGVAPDPETYYRFLLLSLIRGEAIDLERAAAQHRETGTNRPQPASQREMPEDGDENHLPAEEWREETLIANAGMVITAPFLPRLFSLLELTTERGFRNEATAARAVHLLQHMVNESSDSPEFLLPLNKLLCGVAPSRPIVRAIEVTGQEQEAITNMLQALIAHWRVIGKTSVQGLRESFLQREGRLRFGGDRWLLEVEKIGIDVLLEQIPWSFSMIKYSWMPWPLHVEWH